jgi:hypothetical protein
MKIKNAQNNFWARPERSGCERLTFAHSVRHSTQVGPEEYRETGMTDQTKDTSTSDVAATIALKSEGLFPRSPAGMVDVGDAPDDVFTEAELRRFLRPGLVGASR